VFCSTLSAFRLLLVSDFGFPASPNTVVELHISGLYKRQSQANRVKVVPDGHKVKAMEHQVKDNLKMHLSNLIRQRSYSVA
jgi:hypothetical protein